jgi:hypothetical protein
MDKATACVVQAMDKWIIIIARFHHHCICTARRNFDKKA